MNPKPQTATTNLATIRVLQVLNSVGRGGAETFVMEALRKIRSYAIAFDFLVHSPHVGGFYEEITDLGGRIFVAPRYLIYNHHSYCTWLTEFFKQHPEIRVVHGHQYTTAPVYLSVARRQGRYTIAHSHNTANPTGILGCIKRIYQIAGRSVPNERLACSAAAGRWLFGNRYPFRVIANCIDTQRFNFRHKARERLRRDHGIGSDSLVIGHVGSFTPAKNHRHLMHTFAAVLERVSDAHLVLVGDGKLRQDIAEMASVMGVQDKVLFLGVRSDVNLILQAMDVLVMPSLYEGFPVVLVEAQAAGLPCLIAEQITPEVKLTPLVQCENLKASHNKWAQRIVDIPTGDDRSIYADQVRERGFDSSQIAKGLADLYRQCVALSPCRGVSRIP